MGGRGALASAGGISEPIPVTFGPISVTIGRSSPAMNMTPFSIFRLGLAAVFLAVSLPAHAQTEQKLPSVSVTGEATVSSAPDIAILQAGVSSQAKNARDAMAASGKQMAAVLAALKESGIAEKDIQTSRLRLEPVREQNKNPAAIIAVEGTILLSVRIREVGKSADILDKMIGAGANLVTGINFEVSEASKLLDQARVEAISDAKRKAEIYAKAAGVALGRPLSISEGYISRPKHQAMAMRAAMPVAAGEETIGITVSVAYELLR
jgi:uncharacterized protein